MSSVVSSAADIILRKEVFSQTTTVAVYEALTGALEAVLGWIGTVLTAIMSGQLNILLPLFAIGVVISVVMLGVKLLRSFTWGS